MRPKYVMANGCFDPTHIGHVLHLEEASRMGDYLIVALTSDASVRREKGESRPMFNEVLRSRMLGSLRCVDDVIVFDSVLEAVKEILPDVFVKGSDYVGKLDPDLVAFCKSRKIDMRFTSTPKWSATEIGNALRGG